MAVINDKLDGQKQASKAAVLSRGVTGLKSGEADLSWLSLLPSHRTSLHFGGIHFPARNG